MKKSLWIFIGWMLFSTQLTAAPQIDSDLIIYEYKAENPVAKVLWLPSEYGALAEEKTIAKAMAEKGFEVTMPDFFESYFLPAAPSSLDKVSPETITALIESLQSDDIPLIVVSSNVGSILAVRGLVSVQQKPMNLTGLVLLNPNLYVETPEVGESAQYWPAVSQLNLPVYVLQAELSPWRWRLSELQKKMAGSGSDVFVQVLPQVRDRFYFRPDAMLVEKNYAKTFATQIEMAAAQLSPYLAEKRLAKAPVKQKEVHKTPASKKSVDIVEYDGDQGRKLLLEAMDGKQHNIDEYQGKVILLNFWASWCPPCVHEMPSMARLKDKLKGESFEILAANLAEERPQIETFTKEHPVNFPILLDPKGSAVKEWKVFAYPSTYIIDKKGQIRYALFGGYEWDNPDAMTKIRGLLAE